MQTEAIGDLREEICVRKSYNLQFANKILRIGRIRIRVKYFFFFHGCGKPKSNGTHQNTALWTIFRNICNERFRYLMKFRSQRNNLEKKVFSV